MLRHGQHRQRTMHWTNVWDDFLGLLVVTKDTINVLDAELEEWENFRKRESMYRKLCWRKRSTVNEHNNNAPTIDWEDSVHCQRRPNHALNIWADFGALSTHKSRCAEMSWDDFGASLQETTSMHLACVGGFGHKPSQCIVSWLGGFWGIAIKYIQH